MRESKREKNIYLSAAGLLFSFSCFAFSSSFSVSCIWFDLLLKYGCRSWFGSWFLSGWFKTVVDGLLLVFGSAGLADFSAGRLGSFRPEPTRVKLPEGRSGSGEVSGRSAGSRPPLIGLTGDCPGDDLTARIPAVCVSTLHLIV